MSPELLDDLGLDPSFDDGPKPEKDADLSYRLVVVDHTYGSAARRAGIENGDEIVSYFGETVRNVSELEALKELAESLGAKRVEVVVERNDGIHEFSIPTGTLGVIIQGQ